MIPILWIAVLTLLNLFIELTVVGMSLRFLVWELRRRSVGRGFFVDMWATGIILLLLLFGHLFQIGVWAAAFIWCGEFSTFKTAFYHSCVNYSSLGYGDIVMNEDWRLLGGVEAAVGVMMFGVSGALLFAVLGKLVRMRFGEMMGSREDSNP